MRRGMDRKVMFCVITSAFIFSTMEVALKIGAGQFDPLQLTLLRFIIGGVFLLPPALADLKKRRVRLTKGDYGYLLFLGVICICISMLLFQYGVLASNAGTAAVVFSANPMFTMLLAHFFTEEKLSRKKVLCLFISMSGILVMMNPLHMAAGNTLGGMTLIVLSALMFGLYSAFGKLRIRRIGGLAQTALNFLLGSGVLAVTMGILHRPILSGLHPGNLPALLYIGVIVTGIGYFFYFKAIELGGAARGSAVFFLKPVIAPVIALLILSEAITFQSIAGVGILLIGSYMNMADASGNPISDLNEENVKEGKEICR